MDSKEQPLAVVASIVIVATVVLLLLDCGISVFPEASSGEQLGAIAAIFGGLLGAGGAALAVYLTLAGQRRDEAQKVEAALLMEVAEFGRLAAGVLETLKGMLAKELHIAIPLRDLPTLTAMPEPVVYKATADRISRLPYGTLFVSFHARIAEAHQLAVTLAVTARPIFHEGNVLLEPMLDETKAKTLATGWYDACSISGSILRRRQTGFDELASAAIAATLSQLDALLKSVGPLVNTPADDAAVKAALNAAKEGR